MMYTFPNKLRNLSISFMIVGFLGLVLWFYKCTKNNRGGQNSGTLLSHVSRAMKNHTMKIPLP